MDAVRLLWGQVDWQTTSRIQTYLKAVFYALYYAKVPISEAQAFTETPINNPDFDQTSLYELARRRKLIMSRMPKPFHYRNVLEGVFAKPDLFKTEFRPTIRRLDPFFEAPASLIFGSNKDPINFEDAIRKKTIILVCLDTKRVGGEELQRLLGTVIVNGLVDAMSFLNGETTWKGRHYLYIDEAGLFATRALTKIMAYQGKSGLWATIAHHYFRQFSDEEILHGIENSCHIKAMFFVGNSTDGHRMLNNMYYGDVRKSAEDAAANLKVKHAMIRIGKEPAQIFTVSDVPELSNINDAQLEEFKEDIYKSNSCYRTPDAVREEIKNRFEINRPHAPGPEHPVPTGQLASHPRSRPDNKRTGDKAPTVKDAPVERGRERGSVLSKVNRKTGISSTVVPERSSDDEPV